MSILSSGIFEIKDCISLIKFSNYNAIYNSNRDYELNYFSLITLLHEFKTDNFAYGNNGVWKIKIKKINIDIFNKYYIGAWGNRSNNFTNFINDEYIKKAIEYIQLNKQISLTCNDSINYLGNFVNYVFNNTNPWPTLVYFSKFISTFLPDLAIPFDTASLFKITREYGLNGSTKNLSDYLNIHSQLKDDLIEFLKTNSITICDFKKLDNFSLIGKNGFFKIDQTPLNRPIDKIYYSV